MTDLGKLTVFSPNERDFTKILETIPDPPRKLYAYGEFPEGKRPKTVAIVGSRHSTKYGAEIAYKMAFELSKLGVVIVSGLAYGIDSISHRGAVAAGGRTIAVLGTPIDRIYPVAHETLAREIIQTGGVVMSEYPPRTADYKDAPLAGVESLSEGKRKINLKASFLERNRLISGLSDLVVVVEAAERSGTLNTAAHALSQGREVFAVPGDVSKLSSVGCNRLISQGATPYLKLEDLLLALGIKNPQTKKRRRTIQGDTPTETAILKLISSGIKNGEEIIDRLRLPVATFNQEITLLEIKGYVKALGANIWTLT